MSKSHICFLFIIYLIGDSITKDNSFTTIKLEDLKEKQFSLKKYVIFEYDNREQRIFNSSINFIFNTGNKPSTNVYIYDSLDKIIKTDSGFINYLNKTTLNSTKCIRISYADSFYRDNCTYYIVLYDISQKYQDSIYVVNSLKYLDFDNEIKFSCDFWISFNFLIEKDSLTYLHYQTSEIPYVFYIPYNLNITNEKGEKFIDSNCNSISDYIKIEPNIKYFVHIRIFSPRDYSYLSRSFSLNYDKYKNNILIKDDTKITRQVLYPQNFTFFNSISDLEVNDTIIISGYSSTYSASRDLRIKIYTKNDFESLIDSFPKEKNGYDYRLIQDSQSNFYYQIKKEYEEQRGLLLGFFVDKKDSYMPINSEIRLIIYKSHEIKSDEKESDIKSDEEREYKKSSPFSIWIIIIVVVVLIIIVIIITIFARIMKKIKRRRESQLQNENNVENSNDNYNYNNVIQKSPINNYNYNNSTSENKDNDVYYNKIEPSDGNGYDNYPAPVINEN